MTLKDRWYRDKLKKKAKKGFQGYPLATVAFYGPDDKRATKVSVAIIVDEGNEVSLLERWLSDSVDVRVDPQINESIVHFIEHHGVRSIAATDRIIGCPHEEGIDYPEGEICPACSFWAGRDRWA
ncbi:hypothetical protein [Paraherbaspirillum soli]|uniref:Uncharacterized protein n=1 Tax=Paraherbaspirillum soli TaxID=631222 RepID=A0ABW0M5U2_9BURK